MSGGTRIGLLVAFAVIAIVGGYYMFFIGDSEPPPVLSSTDDGTGTETPAGNDTTGGTNPSGENQRPTNPAPERPVDPPRNNGSSLLNNTTQPPPPINTITTPEETDPDWDSVDNPQDDVEPIIPGGGGTALGTLDNTNAPPVVPINPGGANIVEDGGKDASPPIVEDGGKDLDTPDNGSTGTPPTNTNPPAGSGGSSGSGTNSNPPPARPTDIRTPPVQYTDYTIKSGDTMTSIAAEWFGDANKWDLIAKANPLVDPIKLKVGATLRLPPKSFERPRPEGEPAPAGDGMVYTVQSGDTLTKIANAFYKSSARWNLIYEANRATIGSDPGVLKVGMKLRIPPLPADDGR